MRTQATKLSVKKTARQKQGGAPTSRPERVHTVLSSSPMVVQRACACGGGCPRCQEEHEQEGMLSVQPKLAISRPDDPYEREADATAQRVLAMPSVPTEGTPVADTLTPLRASSLARQAEAPESPAASPTFAATLAARRGAGAPLPAETRAFFEPRFGADFSDVRIHADAQAGMMAASIQARAFTQGHHVYFAQGQYGPGSADGRRLLAHELAHVVQQPAGARQEATLQRQHHQPSSPPSRGQQPAERAESTGSEISALPLERWQGVTIIDFPPISELVPRYALPDSLTWRASSGRINIVRIPTPAGIEFQAGASLAAGATLSGGVGPVELRNIRAAFSQEQASRLHPPPPRVGPALLFPPRPYLFANFHPALAHAHGPELGTFYVEAELTIPADLAVDIWAGGELEAAATVAGIDIATLQGGIRANAGFSIDTRLSAQGQYSYRNGHLNVDHRLSAELDSEIGWALTAFLEASLLGFTRQYDWTLVQGNFRRSWQTRPLVEISTDSSGRRRIRRIDLQNIVADLEQVSEVVQQIFANNQASLEEEHVPTGGDDTLSLPGYIPLRGGTIDRTLLWIARSHRINDAGISMDDFQRKNVAVGKVAIGDHIIFIPKTNLPGQLQHSEDQIIAEMHNLWREHGERPVLQQLFSERRPCTECTGKLNGPEGRIFGAQNAQIFFAVSYRDPDLGVSRANELRHQYGLAPAPRRRRTEPESERRGARPRGRRSRRGPTR